MALNSEKKVSLSALYEFLLQDSTLQYRKLRIFNAISDLLNMFKLFFAGRFEIMLENCDVLEILINYFLLDRENAQQIATFYERDRNSQILKIFCARNKIRYTTLTLKTLQAMLNGLITDEEIKKYLIEFFESEKYSYISTEIEIFYLNTFIHQRLALETKLINFLLTKLTLETENDNIKSEILKQRPMSERRKRRIKRLEERITRFNTIKKVLLQYDQCRIDFKEYLSAKHEINKL